MIQDNLLFHFGRALLPFVLSASIASAAASFSNSLKGFTGDSTQPATQSALATAGFSISSTHGLMEYPPGTLEFVDPTIQFDSSGAHFGDLIAVDNAGRNYIRTNDADYANVSFAAEVTFEASAGIDFQDIYFGMGAGNANPDAFRTPDWQTPNSSVMYWGETEAATPDVTVFVIDNGDGPSTNTPAPDLADGTHRVRLSYDRYKQAATFSFDLNYAGGPFAADVTAQPVNVSALYGADGWITEPARVFFGGDESLVITDFQVAVSSTPITLFGDFNGSGAITSTDWSILRANLHTDMSSLTQHAAYQLGDMTGDLVSNFHDFSAFKAAYDATNGAGSFAAMVASVPEPSTLLLILSAGFAALPTRRRSMQRD